MARNIKNIGPLRQCSEAKGCGLWKTLEFFYKRSDIDAYRSTCTECSCKRDLAHYYSNAEEKSVYQAERYKNNKEDFAKRNSQWKKANKVKVALLRQKRRLAEQNVDDGSITEGSWLALCEFYGNKCLCCHSLAVKLTMDHVVPISKGGRHSLDNIQPLCRPCNSKKHAKVVDYRPELYPIVH